MMEQNSPGLPVTVLDYWRVLQRYRWVIVSLVVVSVLVTGVASKLSPKLYEARATIIPARQGLPGGGISFGGDGKEGRGGSGSFAPLALLSGKGGPSLSQTIQAILLSRKMAEAVVEQLALMPYYETTSLSQAQGALRSEIDARGSKYKLIEVLVLTKDPKMAAEIVNALTSNVHHLHKELKVSAAKQNREFLETRLAEKTREMGAAEEALKVFQTEHRTMAVRQQAETAAGTVVELHAGIVALQVELAVLKEYATPSHPMVNQLQAQISEYRRELDRMEKDQSLSIAAKGRAPLSKKVFPSFEEAPSLALEFLRLTRQLKVEESVYGMLVGMLEQAKIAEVQDLPAFQILDAAVPPEHNSRPKTLENVMVAGAVSLVLGILLALFLNYLELLKARERASVRSVDGGADLTETDIDGNGDRGAGYPLPSKEKEIERLQG